MHVFFILCVAPKQKKEGEVSEKPPAPPQAGRGASPLEKQTGSNCAPRHAAVADAALVPRTPRKLGARRVAYQYVMRLHNLFKKYK